MPGRRPLRISTSGLAESSARQKAISSQMAPMRVAPDGPEAGRVDLDDDPVRQIDGFAGTPLDQGPEQGHPVEEPLDIAEHHAGLPAVGGDDHEDPALAGGPQPPARPEAGEVDGDQRGRPALAAAPA